MRPFQAMNKLNVLHLHFSDFCRFALESKEFPELTAKLTGAQGGFYTQDDMAGIVLYAAQRGKWRANLDLNRAVCCVWC